MHDRLSKALRRRGAWLLLATALVATAAIYWAGLRGGFVYDDFSFVVGNRALLVPNGRPGEWLAAALSFPSGIHQGRWLTMLSFAANAHATGMKPFPFKLTNLGIHLANGVLLFLALRGLFALHRATRATPPTFDGGLAAALIAALWLVLPINLTAVLYVSQRLESLSTTFVLLGLAWYLVARRAHWTDGSHRAQLVLSLLACTGVGVLAKESAVLLPLYAACADFALTGWRNRDGRHSRTVLALYGGLLVVPLLAGLAWLASWIDGPRTYGRAFDIPARLLTEARVLMDYIGWTLAPRLDVLSLYHDDIVVSRGLLDPPTTLASLLAIGGLLACAAWLARTRPLFAIGIGWYFGGHALTATVIPLMLAFEHRNYFPSIGLLLAGASLVTLEWRQPRWRLVLPATALLFAFYSFTTALRAQEWSGPSRLAMSEAAKRPLSADAQFAKASALITRLRRPDGTSAVPDGFAVLERARRLPGAGTLFEQTLITEHARRGLPVDDAWWDDLVAKLRAHPPSASDARILATLNACYIDGYCGKTLTPLKRTYEAVTSQGSLPANLLAVHAEYAWHLLGDRDLAARDLRAAVERAPWDVAGRRQWIVVLLALGRTGEAREQLALLQRMNWFGMLDAQLAPIEQALATTGKSAP